MFKIQMLWPGNVINTIGAEIEKPGRQPDMPRTPLSQMDPDKIS